MEGERLIYEDFGALIADAELSDLLPKPADLKSKPEQSGQVSVQGMVLNAMEDAKLSSVEAHRLLVQCNQRIHGNTKGFSQVVTDGGLVPIHLGGGMTYGR